jgi:hypothetical protein
LKLLLFIISTLLITSCSQKTQKSPLKVTFGAASAAFTGNLIVFGSNDQGASFVKEVLAADSSFSVELNNGIWNFGAIGWDGSNNFEGDSFCDALGPFNLDGNETAINLQTSKAKCAHPAFGSSANANGLLPLKFNTCLNIKQYFIDEGAQAVPLGALCNGDDSPMDGGAVSVRISLIAGEKNSDGTLSNLNIIPGQCHSFTATQASTGIKLPFGSNDLGLNYKVETFSAASCVGLVDTYNYNNSFTQLSSGQIGGATPGPSNTNVYLHADACLGSQLTNLPYATPDASGGSQSYLICTPAQFMNISKASSCNDNTATHQVYCDDEKNEYILGKNIDLTSLGDPATDAYIMDVFKGSFDGAGFTISNGVKPLFNFYQNVADTTYEQRFERLNLSNFNISFAPAAAADSIGILINKVSHDGTGPDIEIYGIKIDGLSSIRNTDTSSNSGLGGLIGEVDHSTGSGTYVFIRENESFANIISDSTQASHAVGGLVGKAVGPSSSGSLAFEDNAVGVPRENPQDTTKTISITGKYQVGGLIGYINNVEIRSNNMAKSSITAFDTVGGLVGLSKGSNYTRIDSSAAVINFIPRFDNALRIGGITGSVYDSDNIDILNSVALIDIPDTSYVISNVGGIVGENASGGSSALRINDCRVAIYTKSDGSYYGGVIGKFWPTSASNPLTLISGTTVRGTLDEKTTSSTNQYRGGVAGYAEHLMAQRSIVDIDIFGDSYLAGIFANSNNSMADEMFIKTNITSSNSSFNHFVGGAFGNITLINNPASDILSNSSIEFNYTANSSVISPMGSWNSTAAAPTGVEGQSWTVISGGSTPINAYTSWSGSEVITYINGMWHIDKQDCEFSKCGTVVGQVSNTTFTSTGKFINKIIAVSSGTYNTTNTECGSEAGGDCSTIVGDSGAYDNISTTTASCPSGGGPFALVSSVCRPSFEIAWKKYGYNDNATADLTDDYYTSGGTFEPFKISSAAQWNNIGDDSFLMNKSYALGSNLDFTSGITPIGSDSNPFQGSIDPNGFNIKNINHTFSSSTINAGIINKAHNAQIGSREDNLVVENVTLNFNNGSIIYGGFIGQASNTDIHLQILNANYTDSAIAPASSVGGIVGHVKERMDITGSGFVGRLDLASTRNVGGIVGSVNYEDSEAADIEIKESYVVIQKIDASVYAGGFIGGFDYTGTTQAPTVSINTSYLRFDLASSSDINTSLFASIVGRLEYDINFDKSFIDFSNATLNSLNLNPTAFSQNAGPVAYIYHTDSAKIGTSDTELYLNSGNLNPFTTSAHLATDNNFSTSDHDWAMDSNGNVVLGWQVNGFDD